MKKLVLVSGLSGAGKTTASNMLEDMGYTVIDQYPAELLGDLIDLIKKSESPKYEKVALTLSIIDLEDFLKLMNDSCLDFITVLLTADKNTIISRYKFTRRIHPLIVAGKAATLEEAIDLEEGILEKVKAVGINVFDTSKLSPKRLKIAIDGILDYNIQENLTITFMSFGYKIGLPAEADVVIDTRVLNNPYWVEELKNKTGNDKEVYEYVMGSSIAWKFTDSLTRFLDIFFSAYKTEEKRHIVVGVGCTGGQHRSVTIANFLYDHYKDLYNCKLVHKELQQ